MWGKLEAALLSSGMNATDIHTVDLLGHGETPRPSRPLHIDDYVRQVRKLILRGDLGKVRLVGHSLGGLVALATAAAHPDMVQDVTVIGVPYGRSDDQRNEWLDLIMKAATVPEEGQTDPPDHLAEVVAKLQDRWAGEEQAVRTAVGDLVGSLDATTFGLVFRISMTSEAAITEMAPEISVPVLVVAGDNDAEVDAAGVDRLARALPQGRSATISDHHHLSILTDPAPYIALL